MMNLYKLLSIDFEHEDSRGKLVQLVHDGYKQVNILYSNKGTIRGKHFHKISSEAFYVASGSVYVELNREGVTERVMFKMGDFFLIPPYTMHSMYFSEDCIMAAMYDIPVEKENKEKDIFSEEEFYGRNR